MTDTDSHVGFARALHWLVGLSFGTYRVFDKGLPGAPVVCVVTAVRVGHLLFFSRFPRVPALAGLNGTRRA